MSDEFVNASSQGMGANLTFEIKVEDSIEKRQLPLVVGVMADLSSTGNVLPRLRDRRFVDINCDTFDSVMEAMSPQINCYVDNKLRDGGERLKIELRFKCLADFEPHGFACQVEPLRKVISLRSQGAGVFERLRQAAENGIISQDTAELCGEEKITSASLMRLDELISRQLDEVIHAPEFQKAEATWRGLYYLVKAAAFPGVKVRVLNATKADLLRDLQRASEPDQSALFKKVHEEAYGILGGEPYGFLIGDYEFGPSKNDVDLLHGMTLLGQAIHAPFIAAASPGMFQLNSFTDLSQPRSLAKIFGTSEYSSWKSFREQNDARYAGLVMPRFLLRLPFATPGGSVSAYEERVDHHAHYLWGNAVYVFAATLAQAFAKHGWCAPICGVQTGGLVRHLPCHTFSTSEGDIAMKCPTEVPISDSRATELHRLGFIPLCHSIGTDMAAFFSVPSCHEAIVSVGAHHGDIILTAQLDHILAASRFVHYLRTLARNYIGSRVTRETLEVFLNEWIS